MRFGPSAQQAFPLRQTPRPVHCSGRRKILAAPFDLARFYPDDSDFSPAISGGSGTDRPEIAVLIESLWIHSERRQFKSVPGAQRITAISQGMQVKSRSVIRVWNFGTD
jgi:hypothetical protein